VKALYDLSKRIAGFDFFHWLPLVKAKGATEIVFNTASPKTDKWPIDKVRRRIESILFPAPALAGLPYSIGKKGEPFDDPHLWSLSQFCYQGGKIEKLQSVLPPGKHRYTVTLRKTQRIESRNSQESDWRKFADEIGAYVIPDYDVQPIGLHERVSLYAGAEMNFFVTNGPATLCSVTPYPMMMFDNDQSVVHLVKAGTKWGESSPWMGKNQFLIWEPGTYDNIKRNFEAWTK
jgi:hypothetical protein